MFSDVGVRSPLCSLDLSSSSSRAPSCDSCLIREGELEQTFGLLSHAKAPTNSCLKPGKTGHSQSKIQISSESRILIFETYIDRRRTGQPACHCRAHNSLSAFKNRSVANQEQGCKSFCDTSSFHHSRYEHPCSYRVDGLMDFRGSRKRKGNILTHQ
jgi:hypothetical protein